MTPTLENDAAAMGLTEFKRMLHDTMQHALLDRYRRYLELVDMSDDPEVSRKCVAMHIQTIGAEHKEKVDPNANLHVFQFNFTSTGMTATQLPVAERVEPTDNLATLSFDNLAQTTRIDADELMAPWED